MPHVDFYPQVIALYSLVYLLFLEDFMSLCLDILLIVWLENVWFVKMFGLSYWTVLVQCQARME